MIVRASGACQSLVGEPGLALQKPIFHPTMKATTIIKERRFMNFFAIQIMSGREDAYAELFSKSRPDFSLYSIKKKLLPGERETYKQSKLRFPWIFVFPGRG